MSTILRALQKIENDTTEDDEQVGPVQPIKPSVTISRRLTSLWYLQLGRRFLRMGLGLVLAVLLIFLTINLFRNAERRALSSTRSSSNGILPGKNTTHKVPFSQKGDGNAAIQRNGPTRPRSYAPEPTYDPNHQPGRYVSKIPQQTPSAQPSSPFESQAEPPLETETISPGDGAEDFAGQPYESEEPVEVSEEPIEVSDSDPEELRYAQVPLLENRKLELQAISWSKTPSQRIAVIENEIMHEGQIVGGYKIIYIGPEQVVVEKGGEQWKVIFMVR